MSRKYLPAVLCRDVVLASVQLLQGQAVHVEVQQRRVDMNRMQIVRHERDTGSGLYDEVPGLAHATRFGAGVETILFSTVSVRA